MITSALPVQVAPLVGAVWQGSGRIAEIADPGDGRTVVATVQWSSQADVSHAFECARLGAAEWAHTPALDRSRTLYAAADILDSRIDLIAEHLVLEEGKLLRDARGEVSRAAATLRYYAGLLLAPSGSVYPPENATFSLSRRRPVGIVGVITPFNYPILLPAWKIAPALAFGNAVVWKCSELTPISAAAFARALRDAGLPPGVLNLVIGDFAVGKALVDGPLDALTFTGSTAIGASIHAAAGSRRVKTQLEMGGKNHALVLEDADTVHAASRIVYGAMSSTGQKCTAIEVAVIDRRIFAEMRDLILEGVARLRVGHGLQPETSLPPLASASAATRFREAVTQAQARGGRVLVGGAEQPRDDGHYVAATVMDSLAPGDPLLTDEVFGPVLALVPVDSDAEAVSIANATGLGLNAGVFSQDLDRGLAVCDQLDVGMVHLGDVTGFPPHIPFGGAKGSAFGPLEQGDTVREFFTEMRMLHIHPQSANGRPR